MSPESTGTPAYVGDHYPKLTYQLLAMLYSRKLFSD